MAADIPLQLEIEALFNDHRRELLWHLLKIVKCEETAADLAQESYLILSQTARQEEIRQPRGFLFKVATHLAFNHLRHNKVIEAKQPILAQENRETASAEHVASQQQRLERFQQIIDTMPPRSREIFILCKIQGMSMKEVAQTLGVTISVVENHVTRGLAYIRKQLLAQEGV